MLCISLPLKAAGPFVSQWVSVSKWDWSHGRSMNGCCPSRSSVPPLRLSQALQVSRDRTDILGPDPESVEGPSSCNAQKDLVSLWENTWASTLVCWLLWRLLWCSCSCSPSVGRVGNNPANLKHPRREWHMCRLEELQSRTESFKDPRTAANVRLSRPHLLFYCFWTLHTINVVKVWRQTTGCWIEIWLKKPRINPAKKDVLKLKLISKDFNFFFNF